MEETIRAGKISASTVAETLSLFSKAMGVLGGVAAAGKSVASDLVGGESGAAKGGGQGPVPDSTGEGTGKGTGKGTEKGTGKGKGTGAT